MIRRTWLSAGIISVRRRSVLTEIRMIDTYTDHAATPLSLRRSIPYPFMTAVREAYQLPDMPEPADRTSLYPMEIATVGHI